MARPHLPGDRKRSERLVLSLTLRESAMLDALMSAPDPVPESRQDLLRQLLAHEYRRLLRAGSINPLSKE